MFFVFMYVKGYGAQEGSENVVEFVFTNVHVLYQPESITEHEAGEQTQKLTPSKDSCGHAHDSTPTHETRCSSQFEH